MIRFLLGHPGCGKTSLLKRIESYYSKNSLRCKCLTFDGNLQFLNQNLEDDIFIELESAFDFEFFTTSAWTSRSLDSEFIWIRRKSDARGRVIHQTLQDNLKEFAVRDAKFRKFATSSYLVPEGLVNDDEIECQIWMGSVENLKGSLTVLPEVCRTRAATARFFERRLGWGIDFFELRTDLVSQEQKDWILEFCPRSKLLYSVRTPENSHPELFSDTWDWPMELGPCPYGTPPVLSCHERGLEPLSEFLKGFEKRPYLHLKLAIQIHDFEELMVVHEWTEQDSKNRSFLPMSPDGRWAWYRLLRKFRQRIDFFQEGIGSAGDQPSLYEWLNLSIDPLHWACILGDPVSHSRTPQEQARFFWDRNLPVFAVRMSMQEWKSGFSKLLKLGMSYAAVTSPLKTQAFESSQERSRESLDLKNANTLYYNGEKVFAHNTDVFGFEKLVESVPHNNFPVAVWGGGGTLSVIQKILPKAQFFSIRSSLNRDTRSEAKDFLPGVVIWASGRNADGTYVRPPKEWRPTWVLDLNYSDESPGREFALEVGARYVSGLAMFFEQAQKQRSFWQRFD